jgi:hypothetical protein
VEQDILTVWVGEPDERILIVNVYNSNPDSDRQRPLRSHRALRLLQQHQTTRVIVGDFNTHRPLWSRQQKVRNSGDTLKILESEGGVRRIEPGTPIGRADSDSQDLSTLDGTRTSG